MKDASGLWIPTMFHKQAVAFNSYARVLLLVGPRIGGKTRAALHRIARHLWEVDGARVGMFVRILKNSKDSGSWRLMTKQILEKEWMKAGIGMRYTTDVRGEPGPKIDGTSRTPFFRVTNMHGGESEMQLLSLDSDDSAEERLKDGEFSMVFFSELDKFGDRRVLTVGLPMLRMANIPYEKQMWIADCNPSEDGDQSWIYQMFFVERTMSYSDFAERQKSLDMMPISETDFREIYGRMEVIEILPKDNIFADPRQLQELRVACATDPGLWARHIEGKWVWGGGDSSRHFRSLLKQGIHILGNTIGPEEDWTVILPSEHCFELVTGWDVGEVNHAACAIEKLLGSDGRWHFNVLAELVSVGQPISLSDFTVTFMEKVDRIQEQAGRTLSLDDHAWSDQSSLDKYSAAADTYPHLEVNYASRSRISLRGVPKPTGSVRLRVNLLKQLLRENRFRVSAQCTETIKMLRDLKKGKDFYVLPEDPNKHIFDAITYPLLMECREELLDDRRIASTVRRSLEVHVS